MTKSKTAPAMTDDQLIARAREVGCRDDILMQLADRLELANLVTGDADIDATEEQLNALGAG